MQASTTINIENRSHTRSTNVNDLEPTVWKLEADNVLKELLVRNNPSVVTDISPSGVLITTSVAPDVGGHILIPLVYKHYQTIVPRCRVRHVSKFTPSTIIDGESSPELYMVGVFFEGNKNKIHNQLKILCENLV